MKLSEEEKNRLEELYQYYLHNEKVRQMINIPMHHGSNCYIHVFKVVKVCFRKALRRKNVDLETLMVGAIFHDYYLYDWRKDREYLKGHGKNHPVIAAENAKRDFNISKEAEHMILTHMWPVNFFKFPKTKEARILCASDKQVAFREFLTFHRHKRKKIDKYLANISKLFS